MRTQSILLCYLLAFLIASLDQYTKSLAEYYLIPARSIYVFPFLNWTLSYNSGAAFSMFANFDGYQRWFLVGISVVASTVFAWWIPQQKKLISAISLTLILGGAIGNLIDRVQQGEVVDFISVHYQQYYFAIFNIADAAITTGAMLLIIEWFFIKDQKHA